MWIQLDSPPFPSFQFEGMQSKWTLLNFNAKCQSGDEFLYPQDVKVDPNSLLSRSQALDPPLPPLDNLSDEEDFTREPEIPIVYTRRAPNTDRANHDIFKGNNPSVLDLDHNRFIQLSWKVKPMGFFLETANDLVEAYSQYFNEHPEFELRKAGKPSPHRGFQGKFPHMWHKFKRHPNWAHSGFLEAHPGFGKSIRFSMGDNLNPDRFVKTWINL
ncbi:hypothetical protein LXL04_018989 [Taraxacum kok-saghyz]